MFQRIDRIKGENVNEKLNAAATKMHWPKSDELAMEPPEALDTKQHDWELIDKTIFKSIFELICDSGTIEEYCSFEDSAYRRKLVMTFRCKITGELLIKEILSLTPEEEDDE